MEQSNLRQKSVHDRKGDSFSKSLDDPHNDKEWKGDGGGKRGEESEDGGDQDAASIESLSSIFLG